MARVNIYLPDELAADAKAAGLNVSQVAQDALREELRGRSTDAWLEQLVALPPLRATHDDVIAALDAVRAEAGDAWPEASTSRS